MIDEFLVNERIDAGAEFICDFDDYASVSVACWIVPVDSENHGIGRKELKIKRLLGE